MKYREENLYKIVRRRNIWRLLAVGTLMLLPLNFASAQVSVEVATVERASTVSELTLTGNIVSTRSVALGSEVAAQVASVHSEVGDIVEQGQLLIQLNDQPAQLELVIKKAQLKEDKASARLAEIEERRLKKLLSKKSVSAESYDQAYARLQQARAVVAASEAEISLLQDSIERHKLRAPFAGVVTSRPVEQGSWAVLGATLLKLSALESLRMELSVPQRYFAAMRTAHEQAGLQAVVTRGNYQQPTPAPVDKVIPFTDAQRNFQVWLVIDNRAQQWLPGMSATAALRWRAGTETGLTVARDALVRSANGQTMVWKIQSAEQGGWQAMPVAVSVDKSPGSGNRVVIFPSGKAESEDASDNSLKPGDQVVTRGNEALRPAQPVKPIQLREASQS